MRITKLVFLGVLIMGLTSCGGGSKVLNDFAIKTNTEGKNHTISNNKTLELSINNPKKHPVSSVVYHLNGKVIDAKLPLNDVKLGRQTIKATVSYDGKTQVALTTITILSSTTPKIYDFKIINEYPHNIKAFTQGLEFYNDTLYESTGHHGFSGIKKLNYKTGEVYKSVNLAKEYFGEGITILNDKIYQLTWKKGTGFIYDVNTFEKEGQFKYGASLEGWGLCNDGKVIYKSDGSDKIWTLNPETLAEESYIQAFHNRGKIKSLNEIEWVNGKIYANRWQKNGVAIINPKNGAIEGVVNFESLKAKVTQHDNLDVLNGIAYNPKTKTLFVTGKYWDKIFEVEVFEKK